MHCAGILLVQVRSYAPQTLRDGKVPDHVAFNVVVEELLLGFAPRMVPSLVAVIVVFLILAVVVIRQLDLKKTIGNMRNA